MTVVESAAGAARPGRAIKRPNRRVVAWGALSVLAVFAVLLALLATVGTTEDHSPLIGKPAPAVSGASLQSGRTVSLAQFAGKWVLVNFAASWCVPCQEEMPQLLAFDKRAPHYDATILTVEYDPGDRASLRSFLAGAHAGWPAVDDPAAGARYGVTGIPESFLVDPDGIVVAFMASGVDAATLESSISSLSHATTDGVSTGGSTGP